MDRRHFLGLTWTSIATLLGGCSSSGSQSTATPVGTETPRPTLTRTEASTETETATEEATETATSTPEPRDLSFQEIYDGVMADVTAVSISSEELNGVDTGDWGAGDLEDVAVAAAKNAGKGDTMNIGKRLYQTFSQDTDELYVDSRRVSLGGYVDILKIFDQKNDKIHRIYSWAGESDEGVFLRDGEEPNAGTESSLAGLSDPNDLANGPLIDPETNRNAVEYSREERNASEAQIKNLWKSWINAYDDLMPGEKYDSQDVTFTEDAARYVAEQEIHGYSGIDHIRTFVETVASTELGDDETLKFFKEGGGLSSEVITGYDEEQGYVES